MSMPVAEESRSVKYVPGREQEIEYVVKLDPQSGLYTRVPKVKPPQVRERSWSPVYRPRRRSNSRDRGNRSFVGRRRSRSPPTRGGGGGGARGRGGRGGRGGLHYWRSRSRSRSRSPRGRSPVPRGRSPPPPRGRSPPPRGRSPRPQRRSRSRSPELRGGTDFELKGMMSETEELRKERERIEQEKEELLAKQKRFVPRFESEREPSMPPLPKPVPLKSAMHRLGPKIRIGEDPRPSTSRHDPRPRGDGDRSIPSRRDLEGRWGEESDQYMDKVMDSVLKAVDDGGGDKGSERTRRTSTADILPGTRSLDELEAVLSAKKKEKMSQMKEKFMKGFQKQQGKVSFPWM